MTTTRAAAAILAILLPWTMGGCESGGGGSDKRIAHGSGEGPLDVGGSGGTSIIAPKQMPWTATFGTARPCSRTGETLTIERVRYEFSVSPISAHAVAFLAKRAHGVIGVGSSIGSPERITGSGRGEVRGVLLGSPDGLEVTGDCDHPSADESLQLLTVLKVGPKGGEVPRYFVDYSTGGEEYTLEVDWQMVACGARTSRDMCPKDL